MSVEIGTVTTRIPARLEHGVLMDNVSKQEGAEARRIEVQAG